MSSGPSAAAASAQIALVLVAAVADNGVIGRDGAMPWRLKSELAHFRRLTMGHPLVMGRKTFRSLGRPLPGRTNIVVTRDPAFAAPGVVVTAGLEAALAAARGDALRRGAAAIMVIGGAEIYAQTLPLADRLELTRVHARPDGDTLLPPIDLAMWRETVRTECAPAPGDEAGYTLLTYQKG